MHFPTTSPSPVKKPNRDDPTPMYHQIRQDLENQMHLGRLPVGAQVPTEQQLCKLHGVSRITARRALEDLREAGIIERTQGRGSFVRKLPTGRTTASAALTEIGILSGHGPDVFTSATDDSWGAQITRSLASRLPEEGFHVTLLPFHHSAGSSQEKLWERINSLGSRLAGVLGFASPSIAPILKELERRAIPWVTVNPVFREQTHNFVSANNFAGGWRVARESSRLGCSSAIFVSTGIRYISNADRFFGFQQGWFEAGREIGSLHRLETPFASELSEETTARLVKILAEKKRPRAVFCGGDLLALGVLKACQQHGLRVPQDVAIVGGTGLLLAEHTTPTLTVLAQPMEQIGLTAEGMLVEMIRTQRQQLPGRYIPCPLIRRESCPIGDTPGVIP